MTELGFQAGGDRQGTEYSGPDFAWLGRDRQLSSGSSFMEMLDLDGIETGFLFL